MGVGSGFCMYEYDVVVKSSRSLTHFQMSSCTKVLVQTVPKIQSLR